VVEGDHVPSKQRDGIILLQVCTTTILRGDAHNVNFSHTVILAVLQNAPNPRTGSEVTALAFTTFGVDIMGSPHFSPLYTHSTSKKPPPPPPPNYPRRTREALAQLGDPQLTEVCTRAGALSMVVKQQIGLHSYLIPTVSLCRLPPPIPVPARTHDSPRPPTS